MSDVSKLINESIEKVISEAGAESKLAEMKRAANPNYDKSSVPVEDRKFEAAKVLAKKTAKRVADAKEVELANAAREADNAEAEHKATVGHHVSEAGKKALKAVQDNPKLSAAVAAGLAAGVGAVALRKRIAAAAKGMVAKK